jgi:dinuclear metal center YbgI/SA1388 family protein
VVRIRDVQAVLQDAYPARLAEDWDTGIGLTCGDPDAEVGTVLLAVDVDRDTVREAMDVGAQLLLTHHPLLFRPVQSVAADTGKGALLHPMVRAGIAHLAAHTNADSARGGVNDALAGLLQLSGTRPLVPRADDPLVGSGRIGALPAVTTLRSFTDRVAHVLPATVTGVRAAGNPDRAVSTVAVCGGAGDSLLDAAAGAGVDVYLTSDLRHHVVAEFVSDPSRPALVEVAHWAGEWPWLAAAAAVLRSELPEVRTVVSTVRTDPWTLHAASPAQPDAPGGGAPPPGG